MLVHQGVLNFLALQEHYRKYLCLIEKCLRVPELVYLLFNISESQSFALQDWTSGL